MDLRLSVQTPFQRRSFDLKTVDNWSTININIEGVTPTPRYGHTLTILPHDTMLVFGGRSEDGYLSDMYTFDLISHSWKKLITKTKISKRCLHSSVLSEDDETVIIFGGHIQDEFLNDTWLLKQKTFEILVCDQSGEIPSGRQGHSAIYRDNFMYVFGGLGLDGYSQQFYSFHTFSGIWKLLKFSDAPPARHLHSTIVYKDKMIVFGGRNDIYLNDTFEFDFDTCQWTRIEDVGDVPCGRYGHTAVVVFGTMLVSGGYGDLGYLNDVYSFDLESYRWTKIKTGDQRPKIYHHRAIIHCDYMYIFGGHNGSYLNDIYRLDLSQGRHQFYGIPNFYPLYENPLYTDTVLKVYAREFHVHKFLISQCPVLLDNSEILDKMGVGSAESFDLTIQYLYGDKIMVKSVEMMVEILQIAQVLKLVDLESVAIGNFQRLVNINNVLGTYKLANTYSLENLGKCCSGFVMANVEKFHRKISQMFSGGPYRPRVDFHHTNRSLQGHLYKLYDQKEFADLCVLTEDGGKLMCHKHVLINSSEYFKKMLTGGFQETFENTIGLPDIPGKILQCMIEFLYCKSVNFPVSIADLVMFVHFSDVYMFEELYSRATNELKRMICIENALEIVNQCVKYQIEGIVKEHCWKVIKLSGVKDQLIEFLFEMHLSTMQGSILEQQRVRELEENFTYFKNQTRHDQTLLKQENETLKSDVKKLMSDLETQTQQIKMLMERLHPQ